jgi:uncharacterized protein YbbC (DUF1343 family)
MQVGLDRLPAIAPLVERLRAERVGLLAHPASVDGRLRHISEVLAALAIRPVVIFGPEHGYGGEAQDMVGVADAHDVEGTIVRSLYGDQLDDLVPKDEDLARIDTLLVDMQDVGSRYYTFVWTALLAARAAARAGVATVLLDRPNPIGGDAPSTEGALQREGFFSFVGLEPLPVRHALTVGEIVASFLAKDGVPLGASGALSIVSVTGWERADRAPAWGAPFVLPSPNMPTADTALVYPGGCLLEGTNLSEGRGTTRPFEIVGAPFVDGRRLASDLAATGLPGFVARPLTFRPTFQKHAGAICGGVQIHVTDARAFRPVATYVALVALARAQRVRRRRARVRSAHGLERGARRDRARRAGARDRGAGVARRRGVGGGAQRGARGGAARGGRERALIAATRGAGQPICSTRTSTRSVSGPPPT